jgi:hypothetical protein
MSALGWGTVLAFQPAKSWRMYMNPEDKPESDMHFLQYLRARLFGFHFVVILYSGRR